MARPERDGSRARFGSRRRGSRRGKGRHGLAAIGALGGALLVAGASPGFGKGGAEAPPAYAANCAGCHGADLSGGPFGTPLRGNGFAKRWGDLDALAAYIERTMPPGNPGGLPKATYRELGRYLLSVNGGPVAAAPAPAQDGGRQVVVSEHAADGGTGVAVPNEDETYRRVLALREARLANLQPVSDAELRNPAPEDWLQWRRTDDGHGFSPLHGIDRENANELVLAWAKALPAGSNAITPLVRDGVMFLNSAGTVLAIDVRSGDTLWRFSRDTDLQQLGPPVTQPRSMAIYQDRLYVPTLDNHIIALDIRTGAVVWDHLIQQSDGFLRMTSGPIVVRGKVIAGVTGCFTNVPEPRGCFIAALDAETGEEAWRFHTIPTGDEPGAETWNGMPPAERIGGGIWTAGTYDPATNLVYFGIGNSYHIAALLKPGGSARSSAGLYTGATVAIDADSGELAWHFQHMARDVWDMDWAFERTLIDIDWHGAKRRAVVTVGKLGILDALDAKTGQYLFSYDMGMQNLVTAIESRTGAKITDPALEPNPERPVRVCPFSIGIRNWPATSYDPETGLMYVPGGDSCMDFAWEKGKDGLDIVYSARPKVDAEGNNGLFAAIDLAARSETWTARYRAPLVSAALATAGGVVFGGGRDRRFRALDSADGTVLWQRQLDNIPSSTPISFAVDGVQYVSVTTGGGNPNDVTRASQTPEIELAPPGTTLWLFKLRDG